MLLLSAHALLLGAGASLHQDLGLVPHRQTALVSPGVAGACSCYGEGGAGLGHLHHGSLDVVLDTRHDLVPDTDQGVHLVLSPPDDSR